MPSASDRRTLVELERVAPDLDVVERDRVAAQDRADVRPVVVAVMDGLDDDQRLPHLRHLAVEVDLRGVVWLQATRGIEQRVSALASKLPQRGDAWKWILFRKRWGRAGQAPQVALLGADDVRERRGNGAVSARRRQLQLRRLEPGARVEQLHVGPPVVAQRVLPDVVHRSHSLMLVDCQGVALDTLQARGRTLALYERYGALLTKHQREVVDMYLRRDWSLAEIAAHQGTSRAAVHDIVRRSTLALQDYEKRL